MTMNPRRSAPRPPTEIRIRGSATPTSPSSRNSNSSRSSTNQRHVRHQSANSTGSNLDKSLPLPPFACSQDSTTTGTNNSGANSPLSWAKMGSDSTDGSSNENTHHKVDQLKPTNGGHKRLLKGLKTRLRSHSFSSSSSSSRDTTTHLPTATPSSPGSGSSLAVNESVAQEYAKTIKSLWKMVEDEERAYRLVEASHSLSGYIPTAAGANNNDAGRVVNRPPYVNTITAALRRPSLPMQLTVPPIQEEEEESPMKTTTTLKTPTAHKTNNSLMVSTIVEMDHTVADLEVSPVGFSDASDAEVETISSNDSEEDEDRTVVRVAQKISVYRGRSLCWSAGAI
ncbi:hypothetical protein BGX29_004697 [Mortierella sp. GBA35]|nr:hypothetical protein BGX29_004697 [Mortierella sp. GBA35]